MCALNTLRNSRNISKQIQRMKLNIVKAGAAAAGAAAAAALHIRVYLLLRCKIFDMRHGPI